MFIRSPRLAAAGLLVGSALLWPAVGAAADATAVADALVAAVGAKGQAQATYEAASADGDTVTITGFAISSEEGTTIQIPNVVVTNPQDRAEGGFTAASISFDGATLNGDDSVITWDSAAIEGALVPSPAEINADARLAPFTGMAMAGIQISGGELATPIGIHSVDLTLGNFDGGIPHDMKMALRGLSLPPALFEGDEQTKATLAKLGYTSGFTLDIDVDSGYNNQTDTLNLQSISFNVAEVGKLTVSAVVSGVPLSKLQDSEKAQELLATGKVEGASIRFQNSGIVERLLDMQAEAMGASRADFVAQISGALPLMLNVIGNPAFQEKVATAAAAFLQNPQSVTIEAAPGDAVPLMQIVGAAMSAPQTLPDVLVIDVRAND